MLDGCFLNRQPIHAESIACSKLFDTPRPVVLDQPCMVSRDGRISNDDIVARVPSNAGNWLNDLNAHPAVRTSKQFD